MVSKFLWYIMLFKLFKFTILAFGHKYWDYWKTLHTIKNYTWYSRIPKIQDTRHKLTHFNVNWLLKTLHFDLISTKWNHFLANKNNLRKWFVNIKKLFIWKYINIVFTLWRDCLPLIMIPPSDADNTVVAEIDVGDPVSDLRWWLKSSGSRLTICKLAVWSAVKPIDCAAYAVACWLINKPWRSWVVNWEPTVVNPAVGWLVNSRPAPACNPLAVFSCDVSRLPLGCVLLL